jgi:predicted RNA-binding protein YlqC (UPF0109 family)
MNEATTAASDQAVDKMQQLILEIVQALVDQPEEVSVEFVEDRDVTVLCVRVSPETSAR